MIPREGMGPLQTQPRGLLGFMQLKSQGRNPAVVPDTLQAVLEMRDWYFATNREVVLGVHNLQLITATTPGGAFYGYAVTAGSAPLDVPNDEWWYVINYSVRLQAFGGGEALSAFLAYVDPPLGPVNVFGLSDTVLGTGANCQIVSARNFWLPPQAELGLWLGSIAAATDVIATGSVTVVRLPI